MILNIIMPNWSSARVVDVCGTLIGYFAIWVAEDFIATTLRGIMEHLLHTLFKPPIIRKV